MTSEHGSRDSSLTLSVDEAAERHRGKWILMRVTQLDDRAVPSYGTILATGPTRRSIQEAVLAVIEESRITGSQYYTFSGHKRIRSGSEWAQTLDQIVERGIRSGRRRR